MALAIPLNITGYSLASAATPERNVAAFSWRRAVLASVVFHVAVLAYPMAQWHLAEHPLLPLSVALPLPLPNFNAAEIHAAAPARTPIPQGASERTISQSELAESAPALAPIAEAAATATILTAAPAAVEQPSIDSRPVAATTINPTQLRTADPGALAGYNRAVAEAVDHFKRYPRLALMRNWQGTALLKLNIGADGRVREYHLARSSGFDTLDEQALEMLRLAMPLPALPTQLAGIDLSIDIPVIFRIAD